MTKPEKREARRRKNGEPLRMVSFRLFPDERVHLISERGAAVFDETIRVIGPHRLQSGVGE